MYKSMSGNEGEWNDGVFSHAAPLQQYQASLREFENGALGALVRVDPKGAVRRRGRYVSVRRPMQGMGKTFLPAFTREQMRGLGHVYQDGVLGADATTSPSISIPAVTITEGTPVATGWKFDITSMFLGMAAGFVACKLLK